ncbi:MAG: PcfB family protein [Oscillospiraceae bacterium]|nr:PcfB family protein [Oscillospiraceae bacterium]
MNHSGDAAEQIVRMSLEGVEVAAKITGTAAKEIATFLVAALKSNNKNSKLKLKGKARMTSMLKSGKALEIFSVKERDLPKFAQGAKQYGIVYCVLRNRKNTPDGLCDIMVKADDAPKISRVVERFKFATVDKAKIESEIVKGKEEKATGAEPTAGAEPETPDKNDTEKLLDDLLGKDEGKAAPDQPEAIKTETAKTAPPAPAKEAPANPDSARGTKARPSEPTSESRSKSARGTLNDKPSVKEEIREITAAQKSRKEADAPKRDDKAADKPRSNAASTTHKQPQNGGRKSKKPKERS